MSSFDTMDILTLLSDEKEGSCYVNELYHALLEYIKSGEAIPDMGHPDFAYGACGNMNETFYSTYKPSRCAVYKLAAACSKHLNNFDMNYTWYRDLSTWPEFCKFVLEREQINSFKRRFRKVTKSHNYYVQNNECPACGARRRDYFFNTSEEVSVDIKDGLVHVECRYCGKFNISFAAFKVLNSFEKKSKLSVFLFTRPNKNTELKSKITPKLLRETLKIYLK